MNELQRTPASEAIPFPDVARPRRDLFGHPAGLTVLFLTDMWGYFGYFGMKAMLLYYLTQTLAFGTARASIVFGTYAAATNLSPVLGGRIADRRLGKNRSVLLGASLMAVGNFLLAWSPWWYAGLAFLVLGTGFFESCLPSQIAGLYERGDPRNQSAYNLYYVGINVGGMLGGIVCGALGEWYGWSYGFAVAGLVLLPGVLIYGLGRRHFRDEPGARHTNRRRLSAISTFGAERLRFLGMVIVAVVTFRISYEQMFNSIVLWIEQGVHRDVGSFTIPLTWFQAVNPLLIIALGPLLGALWTLRSRSGHTESPCARMAAGACLTSLAYAGLGLAIWNHGSAPVSALLPIGFLAVMTVGELLVFPVGLSLFGRLAPPDASAFTLGIWYFQGSVANFLSGLYGTLWTRMSHGPFFLLTASFAAAGAILLFRIRWRGAALISATDAGSLPI